MIVNLRDFDTSSTQFGHLTVASGFQLVSPIYSEFCYPLRHENFTPLKNFKFAPTKLT